MHARLIIGIAALGALFSMLAPSSVGAQAAPESGAEKKLYLRWLGTAGWEITIDNTVILIDPFITRGVAIAGKEWKTDEEAVLKNIKRADYIFAGHSHADHIADIPFIAKKFGSKVIGSRTTTNIALTGGVDKSQLTTISGGEKLDFKDFSVQVIDSEHGALVRGGRRRQPKFEEVNKVLVRPDHRRRLRRGRQLSLLLHLRQASPAAPEHRWLSGK